MLRNILFCAATLSLAGCAGVEVDKYAGEHPKFVMEEYFNGELEAWGMFQKRNGEVVKRFKVLIDASWEANHGVLDEHFTYSDGTTQRRVWHITKEAEDRYSGTADDVVGVATGQTRGNALRWNYTLKLPVEDKVHQVFFDDWMYLMEDEVLVNRSIMKKFGITLGEVTLFFRKKT
jgi:hypothetical protein